MCGIAAFFSDRHSAKDSLRIVKSMCQAQKSRGPDGEGVVGLENGAIGHRRLAIIDVDGGGQPMSNPSNSLHLTYNGELYNYRELRAELESHGSIFRTKSDTEVILHAYDLWGTRCVERFRGMFAFIIVDDASKTLFAARDHFGIKPLVYVAGNGWFAAASEIRGLRMVPCFSAEPDRGAIGAYLQLGYIPAPLSAFSGVKKLPPGSTMTIDLKVFEPCIVTYWEPIMTPEPAGDLSEWAREVERVCRASVEAHLVADVKFGALLSGGVDSTLIVKWMTECLGTPVDGFTICYEEQDYDESNWAAIAAKHFGVRLISDFARPSSIDLLGSIVHHQGEPLADRSAISTWLVCELARKHVPMVLSGDGGDELFYGYESYLGWREKLDFYRNPKGAYLGRLLRKLRHQLKPKFYPPDLPPSATNEILWSGYWQISQHVFEASGLEGAPRSVRERIESLIEKHDGLDPEILPQLVDLALYLPANILPKVDSASMAHGLEVRTPLVDRDVFDLARRIPLQLRRGLGPVAGREGKLILKHLLARDFGNEFAFRKKMGFVSPAAEWLRRGSPDGDQVARRLKEPGSPLRFFVPDRFIESALVHNGGRRAWNLLVLDEWLHQLDCSTNEEKAPGRSCI